MTKGKTNCAPKSVAPINWSRDTPSCCRYRIVLRVAHNRITIYPRAISIVIFNKPFYHLRRQHHTFVMKTYYYVTASYSRQSNQFYFAQPAGEGDGDRIHWLFLCRGVKLPQRMYWYDTKNLMVRLHWCWSFRECREPLLCNCSQVHSGPEW